MCVESSALSKLNISGVTLTVMLLNVMHKCIKQFSIVQSMKSHFHLLIFVKHLENDLPGAKAKHPQVCNKASFQNLFILSFVEHYIRY